MLFPSFPARHSCGTVASRGAVPLVDMVIAFTISNRLEIFVWLIIYLIPSAKKRQEMVAMKGVSLFAFFCLFIGDSVQSSRKKTYLDCHSTDGSLYDFTTQDINGKSVSLGQYRHQIVLAINVATFWGYTYQYHGLNALTKRFGRRNGDRCGFQVLGFPCNQFGKQEPGANAEEILNGLKYVRPGNGFVPNFPMFKKRDVNGKTEDEIYTFFKVRQRVCVC